MREILFRGKRIDNGDWVLGYYEPPVEWDGHKFGTTIAYICEKGYLEDAEVDPSTVGQYTGLTDKNGKRIFEGDVVKTHYANTKRSNFVEQVVFHNGRFCSMYKLSENGRMWANLPDGIPYLPQDKTPHMEWCEVIGNIHDNPELLKEDNHG